jgi:hypothetical protein
MRRYGTLSPASQERFLQRQETARLARYPDDVVRKAISWSSRLVDALSFAHSAYEGEQSAMPPEPQTPSRPGRTSRVAEARRERNPDLDRSLAETIGPVQNLRGQLLTSCSTPDSPSLRPTPTLCAPSVGTREP